VREQAPRVGVLVGVQREDPPLMFRPRMLELGDVGRVRIDPRSQRASGV
jgi:hypothetical protein